MLKFTQDELVELIVEKFVRYSISYSEGVYNKQDPTQFEKRKCKIGMEIGFSPARIPTDGEIEKEEFPELKAYFEMHKELGWENWTKDQAPDPENVIVHINDCTWGIEFRIITSTGEHEGYWSRERNKEGGDWWRCSSDFFPVLKRLFLEGTEALPVDAETGEVFFPY